MDTRIKQAHCTNSTFFYFPGLGVRSCDVNGIVVVLIGVVAVVI